MLRNFAIALVTGLAVAALGFAQQSTVTLPVGKTAPNDGKQMFASYCAPCHGVDGKGMGPVTSSLIQKPVDLTVLAKNNGGKFPATHVVAIINFGPDVPSAHGTKDMPVWGPVLGTMEDSQNTKALRVKNLEAYVESLQVK